MKRLAAPIAACLILLASPATATAASTTTTPDLPRRASLGLRLSPAPGGGARIDEVLPGQSGALIGARAGDRVVGAGGAAMQGPGDVVAYAGTLVAGAPVALEIDRAGRRVTLRGKAIGRPMESYEGGKTVYGSVAFRGGRLRDILVTPTAATASAEHPVLFLIQGYTCATMESPDPDDPYRRIGAALVAAGIAFYRVEKPGSGDSRGGPSCVTSDYATELDAFRSAYRHLADDLGYTPDRIFLFGHSLGGLEAPMLAAERSPRGVGAYGTVVRNWADYMHDIDSFQGFLIAGEDPVEGIKRAEANREMFRLFFFDKQTPEAIAAAHPDWRPRLERQLGWRGGEMAIGGRSYKFLQDLPDQKLVEAWAESRSEVLSMYGESDIVALNDEDHRLIADIANHYRPGTGRFVEVKGTEHGMTLVGDRETFRRHNIAGAAAQGAPPRFNPEIASILVDWVRTSMAKPPVRLRSFDAPAAPPTAQPG